jgi:hypothetical protein
MISASPAFGQAREITQSELTNVKTISADKQKGLPRREKVTVTRGDDLQIRSESIFEYGPNGTYHYIVVRRENGVETKTEGIRIGPVQYYRLKDGTWTKEPPPRGLGGGSGAGTRQRNGARSAGNKGVVPLCGQGQYQRPASSALPQDPGYHLHVPRQSRGGRLLV